MILLRRSYKQPKEKKKQKIEDDDEIMQYAQEETP
jgi:hypothetical protein